jgi:hypothetical protein
MPDGSKRLGTRREAFADASGWKRRAKPKKRFSIWEIEVEVAPHIAVNKP